MAKLSGRAEYPIYFGAEPKILGIAGDLRKSMTTAEKVLWQRLRKRQINGYRFRRQHPLSEFVVDFFCYDAMLVIEVDGDVHNDPHQNERDLERTKILNFLGIKEIRFKNEEVIKKTEEAIRKIESELTNKHWLLSLPPNGGRAWVRGRKGKLIMSSPLFSSGCDIRACFAKVFRRHHREPVNVCLQP